MNKNKSEMMMMKKPHLFLTLTRNIKPNARTTELANEKLNEMRILIQQRRRRRQSHYYSCTNLNGAMHTNTHEKSHVTKEKKFMSVISLLSVHKVASKIPMNRIVVATLASFIRFHHH